MTKGRIPLWFKIAYTAWLVVWMILYAWVEVSLWHFLWLCHIGNIIIAVGLWRENTLLLSWQALSLLIPDIIWTIDFASALATGWHPFNATMYMFNDIFPPLKKALALFHLITPWVLVWMLRKFGYDRRAMWLQAATCWIVFPISYLVTDRQDNINWVLGLGKVQDWGMHPVAYLAGAMICYVLVLYVPSHLILMALVRRPDTAAAPAPSPDLADQLPA